MGQDLGRVAYEAYGDSVEWRTFSGTKMPTWEDQNAKLKQAWNAAAKAVVRADSEE